MAIEQEKFSQRPRYFEHSSEHDPKSIDTASLDSDLIRSTH
jgi:hypothetical protein